MFVNKDYFREKKKKNIVYGSIYEDLFFTFIFNKILDISFLYRKSTIYHIHQHDFSIFIHIAYQLPLEKIDCFS